VVTPYVQLVACNRATPVPTYKTSTWIWDTGAEVMVTNEKEVITEVNKGATARVIHGVNGAVKAELCGSGTLYFPHLDGKSVVTVKFDEIIYHPTAPHNLLSRAVTRQLGFDYIDKVRKPPARLVRRGEVIPLRDSMAKVCQQFRQPTSWHNHGNQTV